MNDHLSGLGQASVTGLCSAGRSGNGGGMNVHADILLLTHKGAPFSVSVVFDDSQLTAKVGAF